MDFLAEDSDAMNDLLPNTLAEMGIPLPSTDLAAAREAIRDRGCTL